MENNPHFYLNFIPDDSVCPECSGNPKLGHAIGCGYIFPEARIEDTAEYCKQIAGEFLKAVFGDKI